MFGGFFGGDEPMKAVALQAIADIKITGNLPADLQVNFNNFEVLV